MAVSINFKCCLKPSIPPRPPMLAPRSTYDKDSTDGQRSRYMMSVAAATCLMITCVDASVVVATELPEYANGLPTERKDVRWSDKIRKCPPWRVNSLENVMPENLPRPSDRRRTDGFVSDHQSAPAIGFNKSCYSL